MAICRYKLNLCEKYPNNLRLDLDARAAGTRMRRFSQTGGFHKSEHSVSMVDVTIFALVPFDVGMLITRRSL